MLKPLSLFQVLLTPWTRRAARRVIIGKPRSSEPADGRFTRSDVDRVVRTAWRIFADLSTDLPTQTTAHSRLNVRLACLTLAFWRALIEQGVVRAYAIELTADLTRSVYSTWGALRRVVKKGDPLGNVDSLSGGDIVPLLFSFNPPGYTGRWVPTPEVRVQREDRYTPRWTTVRTS